MKSSANATRQPLVDNFEEQEIEVLAIAWTVYPAFQLPLNLNEITTTEIKVTSKYTLSIRQKKIVIWDEILMVDKYVFDAIYKFLCDLCQVDELFGGKIIVDPGELRQIEA